jgi:hypothetical protein
MNTLEKHHIHKLYRNNLHMNDSAIEPETQYSKYYTKQTTDSSTEQMKNKQRSSRQTHTQGNNKNNEGKQHRNKTQMENMQSVTTWN